MIIIADIKHSIQQQNAFLNSAPQNLFNGGAKGLPILDGASVTLSYDNWSGSVMIYDFTLSYTLTQYYT